MIKKLEQLKKSIGDVHSTELTQCHFFSNEVLSRDFEKTKEQHFFKKTLVSYD